MIKLPITKSDLKDECVAAGVFGSLIWPLYWPTHAAVLLAGEINHGSK